MRRCVPAIGGLILLAGCGPSITGSTTTTPTTTTSSAPGTTTVTTLPPASTTVTTTTIFPPVDFECPPALVSGQETIRIDADCSVAPLDVEPIFDPIRGGALLMDDLGGGLVFQTDDGGIWWQAVGEPSAERVVSAEEGERMLIQDVVLVGDRVEIWYLRERGFSIEDHVVFLERSALTGGQTSVVGEVGSWETSSTVTVGGAVVALETNAEGFHAFGVTDFELERVAQPWNPYESMEMEETFLCDCPKELIVSDDGSRAVFLDSLVQEAITLPVLVVVDIVSGEEMARVEVSGFGWASGEGPEITTVDILGDLVLINGADEGQPFPAIWTDLGAAEMVWEALPVPGFARFLRSDVR